MNTKILFRGSLTEEKELQAASKYFPTIDSRVKVSKGELAKIYTNISSFDRVRDSKLLTSNMKLIILQSGQKK
jgi:hypothetical protein